MRTSRGGWPNWRQARFLVGLFLLFAAVALIYLWHLGTSPPGLSGAEVAAKIDSSQLSGIIDNPLYAPHKLLQLGFQSIDSNSVLWLRLPSVILGLLMVLGFYYVARAWYGRLVAVLSTLLFATTPWVILLARHVTPHIMLLTSLVFIAAYVFLSRREAAKGIAWLLLALALGFSLYVPGMVWILIMSVLLGWRRLSNHLKATPAAMLVTGVLLWGVVITPLVLSFVSDWRLIKWWLLIPLSWQGLLDSLSSIGWAALALVWRAPQHVDMIIGRLPILSITQIALLVIGAWAMWRRARKELYGLSSLIVLGIVAAGLNQDLVFLTLALPGIGLIIAAGLRYLYIQWRQIFPRNPIPRALALTLMTLLVALNVFLGIRYSLIAWPHTLDTRHTYVLK